MPLDFCIAFSPLSRLEARVTGSELWRNEPLSLGAISRKWSGSDMDTSQVDQEDNRMHQDWGKGSRNGIWNQEAEVHDLLSLMSGIWLHHCVINRPGGIQIRYNQNDAIAGDASKQAWSGRELNWNNPLQSIYWNAACIYKTDWTSKTWKRVWTRPISAEAFNSRVFGLIMYNR